MTDDEPTVHAVCLSDPDSVGMAFGALAAALIAHGHDRAEVAAHLLCLCLDICEEATGVASTEENAPIMIREALATRRTARAAQRAGAN